MRNRETLRAEMYAHLASGDGRKAAHARYRLALLDREAAAPSPATPRPAPQPAPRANPTRPPCDHRESCGCQMPRCLHAVQGPEFGREEARHGLDGPLPSLYRVTADDCKRCGGVVRAAPPPRRADIVVRTYLTSWTGYGRISSAVGRALEGEGVTVSYQDIGSDYRYFGPDPWVSERAGGEGRGVLQIAVPKHTVPGRAAVLSMWESGRIDAGSAASLNGASAVVVPCRHNAAVFRASGVTAPVHVVPMGVDAAVFRPDPAARPVGGRPFRFGMAGRMAHGGVRKGLNEGVAAFLRAFDRGHDVRLELKVYPDCLPSIDPCDDPRVTLNTAPMTPEEMAAWYRGLDCLFVPSKGEGWGMHTAEALACGVGVIATVHSGTADFVTDACCLPLDFRLEPAGEFYTGLGDWAVPTEESMVDQLRWAYGNPEAMREMGRAGAERMQEFPWSRTGRELAAVLRGAGLV